LLSSHSRLEFSVGSSIISADAATSLVLLVFTGVPSHFFEGHDSGVTRGPAGCVFFAFDFKHVLYLEQQEPAYGGWHSPKQENTTQSLKLNQYKPV
jgi:hypothetical protein